MSFNDPIAEFLTRIRNAKDAKHRFVDIGATKIKTEMTKILKENGFIQNYLVNEKLKKIRIFLKYNKERNSVISNLKRISKPGFRRYVGYQNIPYVLGGIGMAMLTTSKGIMDDKTARKSQLGGEILCYVW